MEGERGGGGGGERGVKGGVPEADLLLWSLQSFSTALLSMNKRFPSSEEVVKVCTPTLFKLTSALLIIYIFHVLLYVLLYILFFFTCIFSDERTGPSSAEVVSVDAIRGRLLLPVEVDGGIWAGENHLVEIDA